MSAGDCDLRRNMFLKNDGQRTAGVLIADAGKCYLTNNIFAENVAVFSEERAGGLAIGASAATLLHNTFARNSSTRGTPALRADCPNLLMINNCFAGEDTGIVLEANAGLVADHTLWGIGDWAVGTRWTGAGSATFTNDVAGDPAFLDSAASDYRVRADSAAVDAGVDAGIADDIDAQARPMRATFDIGADEVPPCTLGCAASVPATGRTHTAVAFTSAIDTATCLGTPLFAWAFGDGGSSGEANPAHVYSAAGLFEWNLTVTTEGVTCTRAGSISIESGLPGDCDGDGSVSIGEVQKAINMFLGSQAVGCGVDCNGDGTVSIGEVQKVINAFLGVASSC